MYIQKIIKKIKENPVLLLLSIAVVSLFVSAWLFPYQEKQVNQVQGEDQLAGGITRVAIGVQTKWLTDLIPSSSFTVSLGSSALPVNKVWTRLFESQGTASASYLLTGNTLQVGGFASAAYSRFGVATATSSEIDTIDDLLIVGSLEVDGNAFFDGKASISGNFQTAGRFIFGDNGDTGEINTNDWDISATGAMTGIGAFTADGLVTGSGGLTLTGATAIAIGNNLGTVAIDSDDWDISTTGAITGVAFNANATGNTLTNIDNPDLTADTLDFTAISDSPTLDASLNISRARFYIGLGQAPSTVFEVQGTASASYLLTANTIQIGGFASAAYSRFGVSATKNANYITGTDDLLVSGDIEVFGTGSFNIASASEGYYGGGLTDCVNATTSKLLWTAVTGKFSCGTDTDTDTGATSNSLNFDEFQNPLVLDTNITTTSGSFNWNLGATSLVNVGSSSFTKYIDVGTAGVRVSHDSDGMLILTGLGDGFDEDLRLNLDDTTNTGVYTSTTSLATLNFSSIALQESGIAVLNNDEIDASSELLAIMDDETGSGLLVFATSPTFTTSIILGATGVSVTDDADGAITFLGLSTGFDENFVLNLDDVSDEITVTTSTGVTHFLFSGISASTSLNFEATGYASASIGFFPVVNVHSTGVKLTGDGDGAITFLGMGDGTDENITFNFDDTSNIIVLSTSTGVTTWDWAGIGADYDSATVTLSTVSGIINAGDATSLEVPNASGGTTVDATGEITVDSASGSFNFYDGTAERVLRSETCFGIYIEDPTSTNDKWIGHKRFNDPFTLSSVQSVASGANSAGWNLYYGAAGSNTTTVWSTNRNASTSSYPTYTSFTNSTILNNNVLDVVITSTSATLQSFTVNVCGRYVAN